MKVPINTIILSILIVFPMYAFNASNLEGFVTFATENYFSLLEILLESIHAFSTRPIIAFGINADIPFDQEKYPRLIKKRIDVNLDTVNIFSLKPRIILESDLEYGIYIEADDIANSMIDTLFDLTHSVGTFPLCPLHPQDPDNQKNIMELLHVTTKSIPYVHAHVLFSKSCMPFIQEWYHTCLNYINQAENFDETLLNVLLWKYNANAYAPQYDPYFATYTDFLASGSTNNSYQHCMFHGCKDPLLARTILQALIDHHNKLISA